MNVPDFEPAFNTFGLFDEESCRFFLREVGERIVPFYPYFVGIEEVYSVLLERYGRAQIADVLSVLHELLEDDAAAGGFGDDGDIWRSWRYSWRHRHDGLLTPPVARVGNFVLPPPTPLFIRRFKAENFATQYTPYSTEDTQWSSHSQSSASATPRLGSPQCSLPSDDGHSHANGPEPVPLGSSMTTLPSKHDAFEVPPGSSHMLRPSDECKQTARVMGNSSDKEEADKDSEQEFVEIGLPAALGGFDPSLCLSFDMVRSRSPNDDRRLSLRGGDLDVYTLQQVSDDRTESDANTKAGSDRLSATAEYNRGRTRDQISTPERLQTRNELEKEAMYLQSSAREGKHTVETPGSSIQTETLKTRVSNQMGESLGIESGSDAPQQRRSSNRQARLIDGAIFTARGRRSKKLKNSPLEPDGVEVSSARSSPVRLSWTGTRQKQPFRQSWLSGVRSLFRNEHHNKHDLHQRHASSANVLSHADNLPRMASSHKRVTSDAPDTAGLHRKPNTYALGLDGSFDLPDSPPKSPINLNKPLPLFPGESHHHRSASSHTRTPSFTHSQDTTYRPSTASTVSSGLSQNSSRRDFREVARDLLKSEIMSHHPDLSPVREVEASLQPVRYPRSTSGRAQQSPISFTSDMNANPFRDDPPPLTPKAPAPLCLHKATKPENGYEARSMPQSRSEPNLQPYTPKTPKNIPIAAYPIPAHLTSYATSSRQQLLPNLDFNTSARGRAMVRSDTPAQHLQKVSEDEILNVKKGPKKRSRSPVKAFFGFGKSSSLRDIAGEPQARPAQVQAEQVKHGGGKSWSNRFRHGFLTSDTDYDDNTAPPATQSPPQQSTFPVSLDPPYQARLLCELELMLVVSANRFLLNESHRGRISATSLAKLREAWESMNRPQVIEFQYDLLTQRELVMVNLKTLKLHGECAENPIMLNAAMYGWKTMAKEMSVRTFCAPDSVIRKWMHDAHKIFEMLDTGLPTFLAFQELQVKTLAKINDEQRKKMERKQQLARNVSGGSQQEDLFRGVGESARKQQHQRSVSEGSQQGEVVKSVGEGMRKMALSPTPTSQTKPKIRKATGAEIAIEGSPSQISSVRSRDTYENSRGGRLGMMVRDIGH